MKLLNNIRKYCLFSLLAVFFATTVTAGELSGWQADRVSPGNQTGMDTSLDISGGSTGVYINGYPVDHGSLITYSSTQPKPDIFLPGYLNTLFKDRFAVTLYKDDKGNKWTLASLNDSLSLNPVSDIRNMGVLLQLKF